MSTSTFKSFLILASLIALIGCQSVNVGSVELGQSSNKQITILDNPEKITYEKSSIDALVRLDDVRGMDWISEDEIIVDKENTDFPPEEAEGAQWYPHNLYIQSLQSGAQTALYPENRNQGFAQVSPDKSKLFYKTFDLQANTGQGYLMDIPTRKTFAFTERDAMEVGNGRWVDNNSLVYASIEGTIYFANVDIPQPKKLIETRIPFISNISYLNNKLYYTTPYNDKNTANLLFGSPKEKQVASSLDKVLSVVPSPDDQKLAIVRRIKSGAVELLITDLQGNILTAVAQDSQIFGTAWSPDGTRLAYAALGYSGVLRGIYVADESTGLSNALSVDIKFISDTLQWSPTGNRLMITSTQPDEQKNRNRFVTYLVRVNASSNTKR
ncbi:TolB family protein [Cohnella abietis]|uniref:TolB protein n=1 Tax=Cohnella abietis TaxID=2507935 RepID=A0A3T1DAG5_9BACL|nr:PD40 domain-containing protein [Cohnella abietis]BBI35063.1 hypothetical protein KCTCHS21_44620 [Cohnella abietis]